MAEQLPKSKTVKKKRKPVSKPREIKVYECGTRAIIKGCNIEGTLTGIEIKYDSIRYEFSYWSGGCYNTTWLNQFELLFEKKDMLQIGFKKQEIKDDNEVKK